MPFHNTGLGMAPAMNAGCHAQALRVLNLFALPPCCPGVERPKHRRISAADSSGFVVSVSIAAISALPLRLPNGPDDQNQRNQDGVHTPSMLLGWKDSGSINANSLPASRAF